MQVIGWELATVILQIMNGWLEGFVARGHVCVFGKFAALAQIAGGTGGDDVVPGGLATTRTRQQVIKGQFTG